MRCLNLFWQINFARNSKTHRNLHVNCPKFLSDFIQIWSFSARFHNRTESQISWKSVLLGQHKYMRTDEQEHGQKRKEKKLRQTRRIFNFNNQGRHNW